MQQRTDPILCPHRMIRKKNSVEAMLKTAMQSQLDDVKLGLNQLQAALHDIQESRHRYVVVTVITA